MEKVIASERYDEKQMAEELISAAARHQRLQDELDAEASEYQILLYYDWLHEVNSSGWGWNDQ